MQGLPPAGATSVAALAAIQAATWEALSRILKPGAEVTARVVGNLGENHYLLVLRGRTLVAESPTPLAADSTVRVAVTRSGETPLLRLIGTATPPLPTQAAADPGRQLARLGLADTPTARLALAAFIGAGAPLEAPRLQAAIAQLQVLPPTQQPAQADALALVARSGLPALPLTLDAARLAIARAPAPVTAPAPAAPPTAAPAPAAPTVRAGPVPPGPAPTQGITATTMTTTTTAPPAPGPGAAVLLTAASGPPLPAGPSPAASAPPPAPPASPPAATTAAPPSPPVGDASVDHQVRRAGIRPAGEGTPPIPDTPLAQAARAHLAAPDQVAVRAALVDAAATTLMPADDLADYDLVLPLPLQHQGQDIPARIAVTSRRSRDGSPAGWLRVDADLGGLGPISIRLSGHERSVAVHLIADGAGHRALGDGLEDLRAALAALDLSAQVRLSRSSEVAHG